MTKKIKSACHTEKLGASMSFIWDHGLNPKQLVWVLMSSLVTEQKKVCIFIYDSTVLDERRMMKHKANLEKHHLHNARK